MNGPWLLFDDQLDPLQMTNLVGDLKHAKLQADMENALRQKLAEAHDQFEPADFYIKKWGYTVDADGAIPYTRAMPAVK